MEAGRIRFNAGNTLVADYFLTDHLGNIRVVVSDDASLPDKVLEENHYYPFGLHMKGMGYQQNIAGVTPNKYKFNAGSELNTDFDIQIYETAFRGLDPQIGRFWQVDPMAGLYLVNSPFHYALNNPIANNDPTGAVTRNDIYGYIGDLYGSGHGGSWEKGKGFSFWGADDPMAWYTGASIIQEFGLYGQLGITDSWEGSRNSFYRSGGRRGSDFLFEGTTTVGEISKPVLVKGKIKNNTWQTNEIIYPDDWGGSSKWLGPENSLGMLKAQAYFEQNAIHNGLEAAQAKAKAEGLDPYHLTKFSDAAQAAIGFRQMSYGAVAILASPFMMEAGVAALPSLSNGIVNAATQIGGAIQNAGISTHFYINSGINSAKDALVYTYLRTLSIQNFAKIVAAQKILMNSIDLKQGDVYAAWSVLGNISGAFVPPLKPRGIPNANTVGLK
nr:RHS repeat-associated core domain-containing protein [Niabella hibiscisoli]